MIQLPRTPTPFDKESYAGYCLRLAEANGFRSWQKLFTIYGDQPSTYSKPPPVEVMKYISPHPLDDLIGVHNSKEYKWAEHRIHPRFRGSAAICADCIREYGYLPGIFDLSALTACIKHKKQVIDSCHQCKQPIKFQRNGLTECYCGADLAKGKDEPASMNLLELNQAIMAVLEHRQLSDIDSEAGLPLENLTSLSLNTLLGLILFIGTRQVLMQTNSRHHKISDREISEAAAEVFSCWPNNYHKFIFHQDAFRSCNPRNFNLEKSILFENILGYPYPEKEILFIQNTYFDYSMSHNTNLIDSGKHVEFITDDSQEKFESIIEWSEINGALKSSIIKLLQSEKLFIIRNSAANRDQWFLLKNDFNKRAHLTPRFCIDDASRYIGLSSNTFKKLIKSGYLLQRYQLGKDAGATKRDIDDLMIHIKSLQSIVQSPNDVVPLSKALMLKNYTCKNHLDIVIAIITGHLKTYGVFFKLKNALVSKYEVLSLLESLDDETTRDSLYIGKALCINQIRLTKMRAEGLIIEPYESYSKLICDQG